MHGIVDEKTDVYAYGVLILELITGRQALDSSHKSLVMWVCLLLHHPGLLVLSSSSEILLKISICFESNFSGQTFAHEK